VDLSGFYPRENAKEHHTDQFELVQDPTATPVFRRGLPFFFAVRFDRPYDALGDVIRLQFGFGKCQPHLISPYTGSFYAPNTESYKVTKYFFIKC
jgi:hypothetical protein